MIETPEPSEFSSACKSIDITILFLGPICCSTLTPCKCTIPTTPSLKGVCNMRRDIPQFYHLLRMAYSVEISPRFSRDHGRGISEHYEMNVFNPNFSCTEMRMTLATLPRWSLHSVASFFPRSSGGHPGLPQDLPWTRLMAHYICYPSA